MKKAATLIVAAAALVVAAGCSTLRTGADYDRTTDFSKYRTFAIKDVHARNQILERRIWRLSIPSAVDAADTKRADRKAGSRSCRGGTKGVSRASV